MGNDRLDCLACLRNETPCENLVGLYKLDRMAKGLNVIGYTLTCPKNGLCYELKPRTSNVGKGERR